MDHHIARKIRGDKATRTYLRFHITFALQMLEGGYHRAAGQTVLFGKIARRGHSHSGPQAAVEDDASQLAI
jgi:hypothetical protein